MENISHEFLYISEDNSKKNLKRDTSEDETVNLQRYIRVTLRGRTQTRMRR